MSYTYTPISSVPNEILPPNTNVQEPIQAEELLPSNNNQREPNLCPICYETLLDNNQTVNLDGCSHIFHASCIIPWFRTGNNACPCCRFVPSYNLVSDRKALYTFNRKYAQRKKAPLHLKKLVENLRKQENLHRRKVHEYNEWRQSEEGKLYKTLVDKSRRLQNVNYWRHILNLRSQITNYPIIPIPVLIPVQSSSNSSNEDSPENI
jgi:hypothetical protein